MKPRFLGCALALLAGLLCIGAKAATDSGAKASASVAARTGGLSGDTSGTLAATVIRQVKGQPAMAVDLFWPSFGRPAKPPASLPCIVLSHGFGRTKEQHTNNARHLAKSGFLVAVPDDVRAEAIADHVKWLVDKGMADRRRVGLAGHSAGGSASLEATVLLQGGPAAAAAVCLLDGVPVKPTANKSARELKPLPIGSFRAEPSSCNREGNLIALLKNLSFEVDDILVVGSTHCDQEDPSDFLCGWVCGDATPPKQRLYRDLMTSFFEENLVAGKAHAPGPHAQLVKALSKAGAIQVTKRGGSTVDTKADKAR